MPIRNHSLYVLNIIWSADHPIWHYNTYIKYNKLTSYLILLIYYITLCCQTHNVLFCFFSRHDEWLLCCTSTHTHKQKEKQTYCLQAGTKDLKLVGGVKHKVCKQCARLRGLQSIYPSDIAPQKLGQIYAIFQFLHLNFFIHPKSFNICSKYLYHLYIWGM